MSNKKINIRISPELKKKMDEHKKENCIDWSAKIRKFIEDTVSK